MAKVRHGSVTTLGNLRNEASMLTLHHELSKKIYISTLYCTNDFIASMYDKI